MKAAAVQRTSREQTAKEGAEVTSVHRKAKPFRPPPSAPNARLQRWPGQSSTHVPVSIESMDRACRVGIHKKGIVAWGEGEEGERVQSWEQKAEQSKCAMC